MTSDRENHMLHMIFDTFDTDGNTQNKRDYPRNDVFYEKDF